MMDSDRCAAPQAATEVDRLTAERDMLRAAMDSLQESLAPVLERLRELGVEDH